MPFPPPAGKKPPMPPPQGGPNPLMGLLAAKPPAGPGGLPPMGPGGPKPPMPPGAPGAAGAGGGKMPQQAAGYFPAAVPIICGNCKNFQGPSSCAVVDGAVEAQGGCKALFEPAQAGGPAGAAPGGPLKPPVPPGAPAGPMGAGPKPPLPGMMK